MILFSFISNSFPFLFYLDILYNDYWNLSANWDFVGGAHAESWIDSVDTKQWHRNLKYEKKKYQLNGYSGRIWLTRKWLSGLKYQLAWQAGGKWVQTQALSAQQEEILITLLLGITFKEGPQNESLIFVSTELVLWQGGNYINTNIMFASLLSKTWPK